MVAVDTGNRVEPQVYLTEVITEIVNGHPSSKLDDLLPWAYPAAAALRDVP
jgi:transposase